jgi:protein dithiol oxidoreductase (disulfide-forming)
MKKLLLLAAMSAMLAACGAKNSGTSTTPAAGETPKTPDAAAAAVKTAADLNAATQESAGADDVPIDTSLEKLVAMPDNVKLPNGKWKVGVNYAPVVPAQNTSAEPGQVEVVEFMWLGCPHCADLQPTIEAWLKQKPDYVKFVQEHVMWSAVHRAHGRLLYTLQALNQGALVHKAFDEIHVRKNMLVSLKGDDAETLSIQTAFAKANGISEADFKREYNGFTVNSRLQKADELNRRYRTESVPVVFINGKYRTDVGMAGGKQQLMQLITDLAAVEKGR